jgi:Flp pilus assembly protein TadD
VISTVKDRSVFVPLPELYYSQFFFPVQGILAVYDRRTKKFSALPGADDPLYVQSNPAWSPDGKWIVFTRAVAHELKDLKNKQNPVITVEEAKEFVSGGQKMCYDLYRIPFNGGKGGRAEPIPGASGNGKSNYFPKFSPDGKWIVFCQADAFMLLRPDSTLFIMPADGGNPRRLVCNQNQKMNSWHSWSPNGKWIVFASKANGPYTQLWLTHIDESGNDTPAILLEHFTDVNRAANIPEFVNIPTGGLARIRQRFGDEFAFALRSGQIHAGTGNYRKAAEALRKALKIEPDNVEVLGTLATVLLKLKEVEQAKNADIQYKLGIATLEKGEYPAAIDHCNKALTLDPGFFPARIILGHALQGAGRLEEALQRYKELAAEGVEDSGLYNHYGQALLKLKQYQEAIPQFQRALQIDPSNSQARDNLSRALKIMSGKPG